MKSYEVEQTTRVSDKSGTRVRNRSYEVQVDESDLDRATNVIDHALCDSFGPERVREIKEA